VAAKLPLAAVYPVVSDYRLNKPLIRQQLW